MPAALREGWAGGIGPGYLHLAARKGQLRVCETLVKLGIDVNVAELDSHAVPLGEAATGRHLHVVQWLLNHGASVDGLSTSVATPLMSAAIEGQLPIVQLLLDAGAEINREHLRLPQTALDFAEIYKGADQGAVAAFLRRRGGIRPYFERHNWNGVPGQPYIEHIERALGGFVNPLVSSFIKLQNGRTIAIFKIRIPKKFDYQLLFTVGLASTGVELALCLPSAWPLNRSALKELRFSWPIHFLNNIGKSQLDGECLSHGDVLDWGDQAVSGVEFGNKIKQWIISRHEIIETEREDDFRLPQTLLIVPITSKKSIESKAQTILVVDKKSRAKWDKLALNLSLSDEK
jgi:hypothetical protein